MCQNWHCFRKCTGDTGIWLFLDYENRMHVRSNIRRIKTTMKNVVVECRYAGDTFYAMLCAANAFIIKRSELKSFLI